MTTESVTTDSDLLLVEITQRVDDFARERGYVFSRAKDRILRDLVHIRQRFGQFYCPCQHPHSAETICVCDEVRDGYVDQVGKCHCNLFRKPASGG